MQIIKLDAIDSTNVYLRGLVSEIPLDDFAVVTAEYQSNGRGQRATKWESEKSKNLIISILKKDIRLKLENQFMLNIIVSLAVHKTLKALQIPNLSIKWPNDILSRQNKIGGILIDLVTKKNKIDHAIIGIGLNVNQIEFEQLPKAASLKKITGINYDLNELLHYLVDNLKYYFNQQDHNLQRELYSTLLFRKGKPSTFLNPQNESFSGIIEGVSTHGKLIINTEKGLQEFDLKSIQLMY